MNGIWWLTTEANGGIASLQPQHSWTEMDDGLVEQIASRFGKEAIIIGESSVYDKEHE